MYTSDVHKKMCSVFQTIKISFLYYNIIFILWSFYTIVTCTIIWMSTTGQKNVNIFYSRFCYYKVNEYSTNTVSLQMFSIHIFILILCIVWYKYLLHLFQWYTVVRLYVLHIFENLQKFLSTKIDKIIIRKAN